MENKNKGILTKDEIIRSLLDIAEELEDLPDFRKEFLHKLWDAKGDYNNIKEYKDD